MKANKYGIIARSSWVTLVLALAACTADPGADGKNGTSCTLTDNADASKSLKCTDGTAVDIKSGTPGKDGATCKAAVAADGKKTITCTDGSTLTVADGANGKSCTVKDNADGSKTLTCEDGTTTTVKDGVAGKDGAAGANGKSCTVKDNADASKTITCEDGTTVTVANGKDGAAGKGCTVKDNGDGTKTIDCADGTKATVGNGAPGLSTAISGLVVDVKSVSTVATDPIKVNFTMMDNNGYPIDVCGKYSLNTVMTPRFGLAYVTKDAAGNVLPYTVLTKSGSSTAPTVANPTVFSPLGANCKPAVDAAGVSTGHGTLVDNGAGNYTYTFPIADTAKGPFKVAYEATKLDNTHVVWIQAARQQDTDNVQNTATFKAIDKEYAFVPSGKGTPERREIVATATCNNCHRGFQPEGTVSGAFHGAGRVEAPYCNMCHNDRKNADGTAKEAPNSGVFIHRLHNSHHIDPLNLFYNIKFAFPQDVRNCKSCHAGSLQTDQWKTHPSRLACTSCHDYVDVKTATLAKCAKPRAVDANGVNVPCQHTGGVQPDSACATCHTPDSIAGFHKPVAPPDPNNAYTKPVGGNNNTNAAYLASAAYVPATADVISYHLMEVTTWLDGAIRRPQMTFKFKKNGTDVVFATFGAGVTELIPNFVGSPSAYFVYAVPQDGISMPADFNASASVYIRSAWNGTTTDIKAGTVTLGTQGTTACTVQAPCTCGDGLNPVGTPVAVCKVPLGSMALDVATGHYTIKLNTALVPANATMLTGGLGYSYSLASTQPLTQTNVADYPYNTTTKVGGLLVPSANVWLPAKNTAVTTGTATTGYQGTKLCSVSTCTCTTAAPCNQWAPRRTIVDNAQCLKCHAQLGAAPTFHAGQRNNGPTCNWCHNPNRTSTGWNASAKGFIHAIHGARKRTIPFTWQALSSTENFGEVEFPGSIGNCTACHVPGGFDFSSTAVKAALPNMLMNTVAQGKYNADPLANGAYYKLSPYVIADNTTDYGKGFSYSSATGLATEATATTLVITPITAACVACHDSDAAVDHMQASGGHFYDTRANVKAPGATKEQCLLCHGPGKIAAIATVHK